MLDTGIDSIINQVVNPKVQTVILPCVQESVYAFLKIDPATIDKGNYVPISFLEFCTCIIKLYFYCIRVIRGCIYRSTNNS